MMLASAILAALSLLSPGLAQDPGGGANGPQGLQRGLDRLGRKTPPPRFTGDDAAELERADAVLVELRRWILKPGTKLSAEELAEAEREVNGLLPRVLDLRRKRDRWERFQANPDGDWDAEPGVPTLESSTGPDEEPVDVKGFYRLLMRFQILDFDRQIIAREDPSSGQWRWLAADFAAVARGGLRLSGTAKPTGYRLRAAYLQGVCLLYAAGEHHLAQELPLARATWEEGLRVLDGVDSCFKLAIATGVDPDELGVIYGEPRILDELQRDEPPRAPHHYTVDTPHVGTGGTLQGEVSTFDAVRARLTDYCPWGVPVWFYLKDAGLTEGFDLSILRPFGGDAGPKLWATGLGPAAIPPVVRRTLDDLGTGSFRVGSKDYRLEWEAVRGTSDCTVWFVSPTVRDMTAAEFLGYVVKAVTLLKCGLISIAGEFGGDLLGRLLEEEYPEEWECQVALATATSGSAWEVDECLRLKREGVSGTGLARSALLKILSTYEKAEMEELFEGISPREDHVQEQLGGQKTYDGSWMPPIVVRAAVSAFEKVPDDEYRRLWLFTRYWILDPRGFDAERVTTGSAYGGRFGGEPPTGGALVPWDLSKATVDDLPARAGTFTGTREGSERIWQPVPETKRHWGSKAHVALFQPQYQVIWFRIAPKLLESWRKDCPEGHDLAVVIRFPPPYEKRVEVQSKLTDDGLAYFGFRDESRKGPSPANEGVPWREGKLFSSYDLHVLRGPRTTRWDVDVDDPDVVELARVPARFVKRRGRPIVGELRYRGEDRVDLHLTYEGEADRTFELEPQGGSGPLLPTVLDITFWKGPGNPIEVNQYDDAWKLQALLGPVAQGWHTLHVKVTSPAWPGPQDFVVHDCVTRPSAAAVFRADIPVPSGRSEVVLSAPGVEPVSLVVERARSSRWKPVDHADFEGRMGKAQAQRDSETTRRWRLIRHCSYLYNKVSYAEALATAEQYVTARAKLDEVTREWPNLAQMQGEKLDDDYRNLLRYYSKVLADVAFHLGDAKTAGESTANYLYVLKGDVDLDAQRGGDHSGDYQSLGREWTELLDRLIVVGADPAIVAKLHADWIEVRRLSGFAKGDFDRRRFRYLQEGY